MMTLHVALMSEQNVDFAVVAVRDHVLLNRAEAERTAQALSLGLGRPAVLLGERHHQTYGREDIVRFLQPAHLSQLPWRELTLAA